MLQATTTPIQLVFWTLFQEHPFRWRPQAQLSMWLSMAAIVVMVPAIFVYDTGSVWLLIHINTEGHQGCVQQAKS